MDARILKKRIKTIRSLLNEKKIDCLIITKPANVTYTTGFLGEDSWGIITKNRVFLLTDSRYTEQAENQCIGCKITQRPNSLTIAQAAAYLVKKLKSIPARLRCPGEQVITIEKSTSLVDFELLKKNLKAPLKSVANTIETVRSSKDTAEISAIKNAVQVAAKALKKTLQHIKPGITENELAGLLNLEMRKLGATNGFETIVAFGPNASRPHHQPSQRKLKKKDTILIDFGAKYNGYCCDITRCFVVGNPTKFYKKVYDIVEKAQAAAIKIVKAGVEIAKVDAAARKVIAESGLPVYGHGSGHGFGLEIHELPFLKAKSKGKLRAGEVVTIEPGIYIPGKIGVRIEDDILITKTGCEILTRNCPHLLFLANLKA